MSYLRYENGCSVFRGLDRGSIFIGSIHAAPQFKGGFDRSCLGLPDAGYAREFTNIGVRDAAQPPKILKQAIGSRDIVRSPDDSSEKLLRAAGIRVISRSICRGVTQWEPWPLFMR
jgi:hypothetical protein